MPDMPKLVPTRTKHNKPKTKDREARGYGELWRKLRLVILAEQPLCSFCGEAFATEVHHIDHNTRNNNRDNLAATCKPCHTQYHLSAPR